MTATAPNRQISSDMAEGFGLYAIIDRGTCVLRGLDPRKVARAFLRARPTYVQYRAKDAGDRETLEVLADILRSRDELAPATLVFANDRADMALLSGADGVHVGQEDMLIEHVRAEFPGLLVGLSTHSSQQVERAISQRPDYVAVGPVFATSSKVDHEAPLGLEGVRVLATRLCEAGLKSVAIGGVDRATAVSLRGVVDAVAVISALLPVGEKDSGPLAFETTYEWMTARAREFTEPDRSS